MAQAVVLTWRKCIRSYDKFTAEVQWMTWMTSSRTMLYGVYSWTLHSKLQFILVETIWRIYDLPRISSWSLWNSYSKWLKSWSRIRQKSVDWPRLITKNLRGDRRLYYVTKRLRLRMPKTYVFADSVLCLGSMSDRPVEAWKNKIKWYWETCISKIWIESTESRWSSSGKYSQDSPRWAFSKRFKNYDRITVWTCAVQRHLHANMYNDNVWRERGNTEKCEKNSIMVAHSARRFLRGHRSFRGPGSEKKWSRNSYVQTETENWIIPPRTWWSTSVKADTPVFRGSSALERGDLKSKGKGTLVRTLLWRRQHRWIGSAHDHLGQSAQHVSTEQKRTCATSWLRESLVVRYVQEKLLQNYEQQFTKFPDHLQLIKLGSNVGITKTVARWQYFTTLDYAELDTLCGSWREYFLPPDSAASKVKRMDPWEKEDRSSVGRCRWVIIMAVTESRSRSNPHLLMEPVLG